ncbi:Tyrosine-protein kinase receptor torso [Eumeta japonica]|uniref:Tyrosine-protein kinase receptor torso n=1 Tax=Eumeta variegata TaxID=151549 RepID=A0A4C1UM75_EUMVA|nr:Tyrosine-protein kinase receptor torso [Eumeta japonica]
MYSCWRARPRDRPTFAELQQRLDALLADASANSYLTLEVDDSRDVSPLDTPGYFKYLRNKLSEWTKRGEVYERPLPAVDSNHYTTPPGPKV